MDFELKIEGTPAKFAVMVDLFDQRLRYRDKNVAYRFHMPDFPGDIPPDTNLVNITFTHDGPGGRGWLPDHAICQIKTMTELTQFLLVADLTEVQPHSK